MAPRLWPRGCMDIRGAGAGFRHQSAKSIRADVISRIGGALAGKGVEMAQCIRKALKALLEELSGEAGISPEQIDALAITGNTAMLYLLTETDPDCLSHAPFEASRLFGELWRGVDLELPLSHS